MSQNPQGRTNMVKREICWSKGDDIAVQDNHRQLGSKAGHECYVKILPYETTLT